MYSTLPESPREAGSVHNSMYSTLPDSPREAGFVHNSMYSTLPDSPREAGSVRVYETLQVLYGIYIPPPDKFT